MFFISTTEIFDDFCSSLLNDVAREFNKWCNGCDDFEQLVITNNEIKEILQKNAAASDTFLGYIKTIKTISQERLICVTKKVVQIQISEYVPSQNDLDYHEKVENSRNTQFSLIEAMKNWYPTVRTTLKILSKLYLTIDVYISSSLLYISLFI